MAGLVLWLVGLYWIFNGEPGWGVTFMLVALVG